MFTDVERGAIESVKLSIKTNMRLLLAELPTDTYSYFKECIVTGGCVASLLHGETPNDWDVYLRDEVTAYNFEMFVMSDTPTLNIVKDVTPGYTTPVKVNGKLISPNAITFNNGLQVITRSAKSHREEFDFIHTMPYFDMATQKLYISRDQFFAIMNKKLVKNPLHPHNLSEKRIEKFINRGWRF